LVFGWCVFCWFVLVRGCPWVPPKHLGCFGLVVALSFALRRYARIPLFVLS